MESGSSILKRQDWLEHRQRFSRKGIYGGLSHVSIGDLPVRHYVKRRVLSAMPSSNPGWFVLPSGTDMFVDLQDRGVGQGWKKP